MRSLKQQDHAPAFPELEAPPSVEQPGPYGFEKIKTAVAGDIVLYCEQSKSELEDVSRSISDTEKTIATLPPKEATSEVMISSLETYYAQRETAIDRRQFYKCQEIEENYSPDPQLIRRLMNGVGQYIP